MTRRTRLTVGISLIVSAITLVSLFIVSCFKKKNIWSALLAIAALEGGAGAVILLTDDKRKSATGRKFATELFDETGAAAADAILKAELSTEEDEVVHAPRLHIEIPRDEEASEADFL